MKKLPGMLLPTSVDDEHHLLEARLQ